MTITAGALGLGGILLFVGLAIAALLLQSGDFSNGVLFDAYIWRVTRFTLLQASLSTLLSVVLAIPVARALARRTAFPGRVWVLRIMALPLGLPVLVGALGLIEIWGRQGVLNTALAELGLQQPVSIYGLFGILLAHVFFNMPLVARLFLAGLERIPSEYWRTAANLGMPPGALLRFVEWPVLRGLLPGAAGLVFMLCATSFTLVLTLGGGPAASTIEVAIYQALRFDFDPPRASALSALQIVMTGVLLFALARLATEPAQSATGGRASRRYDTGTGLSRVSDFGWILFSLLFIGAPLMAVLSSGLRADLVKLAGDPTVHRALLTSIVIAVLSAFVCVGAAAAMIRAAGNVVARRGAPTLARAFAGTVTASTSLVLLVPPVVLGAGWFLLLRPFGDVARFAPAIVIAINALMALPFVHRILAPAMATHAARTDRLTASLGIHGFHRLRWIDLPPLRKPLLMAFSFAMALSLGD
ncbi:MAG: thiamine/thiamine pyrophosphate ABC transporter permease ThiP, partial [Ensifer adhaerens]